MTRVSGNGREGRRVRGMGGCGRCEGGVREKWKRGWELGVGQGRRRWG